MANSIGALADRIANIKGHEIYAYGQGSYDGDACRTCSWQGPTHSGKAHEQETRRDAIRQILAFHLAERAEQVASSIEEIPVWDGYADAQVLPGKVRDKAAELVRGTALI